MDSLTLQIKSVCIVSIFTGILSVVIPSCRLKKAFNSFCAVVIVFTILMPFSSFGKGADDFVFFDSDSNEEGTLPNNDTAEKFIYGLIIENALNNRFAEMGLHIEISAECEKLEDEYRVTSFTVYGCKEEEKEKVTTYFNEGFSGIPINFAEE